MILSVFDVFAENFAFYKQYFGYMIKNPAWNNPLYMVFFICVATFIMELTLPRKMPYSPVNRKGFALDIFYVIFIDFLLMLFGFYAAAKVVEYLFTQTMGLFGVSEFLIFDITQLHGAAQFLIVFLILDFMQWFGHFLLHRIDFFWHFHKIHHAQEELGFASTRHFHWMEYLVFKPLLFIPFILLNVPLSSFFAVYLWVGLSFTFFSHANIRVNFKPLNYVLITPETHYWHHAKNIPGKYGVNFASVLTIWDHIFGYFYYPKNKEVPHLGVDDQAKIPSTFVGQMIHPFREAFGKKKKMNSKVKKK